MKLLDNSGRDTGRTLNTAAILASPGEAANLVVSLSDASAAAGAAVHLSFDKSVFSCDGIVAGDTFGPSSQTAQHVAAAGDSASFAVVSASGHAPGPSTLVTFRLRVLPTAAAQNATIRLSGTVADAHGNTIGRTAVTVAASPAQAGGLIGDLMGTGQPEVGSAIKILRVVVGLDVPPADITQWDCDSSGAVEVGDAIKILRCVVGLDTWPIGGATTMSYAQRQVTRDAITAFRATLPGTDRNADNAALADFMSKRPEFKAAGVVPGSGSVWGCYQDGRLCIIINNDDPSPTPLSAPQQMSPQAARSGEPHGQKARLVRSMGTAFPNCVPDLQTYVTAAGYTLSGGDASVASLRTVAGDSIFYIHGHGGQGNIWNGTSWDQNQYSLWTSDPVTPANDGANWDDLVGKRVGEMYANQDADGGPVWHYCITPKFVEKYMSFGANSLVVIHGCSGDTASFKNECIAKGASLYVGWTYPVMSNNSAQASRFIFDRMLGANLADPKETPPQRPFDYQWVWTDMMGRGFDVSQVAGYPQAHLMFTGGAGDSGILAPSIKQLAVDEVSTNGKSKLTLSGLFGPDPGAANRKVTVADTPLNVTSWSDSKIECDLPLTGAGSSGDTQVQVYQHKSNKVPLSEWVVKFHFTRDYGKGSLNDTMDLTLHIRADVHSYRDQPAQAPTQPTVPFISSQASGGDGAYTGVWQDPGPPAQTVTFSGGGSYPCNPQFGYGAWGTDPGVLAFGTIDTKAKTMQLYMWANGAGKVITGNGISSPAMVNLGVGAFDSLSPVIYPPNGATLAWPLLNMQLDGNFGVIAGEGKGPETEGDSTVVKITWQAAPASAYPVPNVTPAGLRACYPATDAARPSLWARLLGVLTSGRI